MNKDDLFYKAMSKLSELRFSNWLCYCFGVMGHKMDESDVKLMEKDLEQKIKQEAK